MRASAIDTIGAIGAAASSARPELEAALTDREISVQTAAALALVKTRADPAGGLQHLRDLLTGQSSRDAAWRLGELASQPEGKQVLAALVAGLGAANPANHEGFAHSIAAFGEEAAPTALVPLTKALGQGAMQRHDGSAAAQLSVAGQGDRGARGAAARALNRAVGRPASARVTP